MLATTPRAPGGIPPAASVRVMTPMSMPVAVGLGCDRGTPLATLQQALDEALALVDVRLSDVVAVASIDIKADEPGLLALGARHGWTIRFYAPEQLAAVSVPNPSETVRKYTGTPSVSEAAALLVAGSYTGHEVQVTELLLEKHRCRGADGRNATISLACCHGFAR